MKHDPKSDQVVGSESQIESAQAPEVLDETGPTPETGGHWYGGFKGETKDAAYERIEPIVRGIAYKYASTNSFIDMDDLMNDLWLNLLDSAAGVMHHRKDGHEFQHPLCCITSGYAATMCHRRAADKFRYHKLRRDANQSLILEMESDDDDSNDVRSELRTQSNESDGVLFTMLLHQIIDNCTEPGTKDRKWLVSKFYYENLLTDETLRESDRADLMVVENPHTEQSYVYALGYKSPRPGSWGKSIWVLRQRISEYLWGHKMNGASWDNFFERSLEF